MMIHSNAKLVKGKRLTCLRCVLFRTCKYAHMYTYIYITYTCKIHIYVVLVKSGDGVMAMHNMICVIDIMCKYCKSVYAVYIYMSI